MKIEFFDDYIVGDADALRAVQALAMIDRQGRVDIEAIKNPINRMATRLTRAGVSKRSIKHVVALMVKSRGPVGTGKYACSCNNFGPRWIEDSLDGCCPGCFQWALDHHYEVPTSKLDPNRVTTEMIESNTWGIRADVVKKLNI